MMLYQDYDMVNKIDTVCLPGHKEGETISILYEYFFTIPGNRDSRIPAIILLNSIPYISGLIDIV